MRFLIFAMASLAWAQTPVITTVAGATPFGGAPVRGFSGDGDAAAKATLALANLQNSCDPARFEQTSHIALDGSGNIYFTDSNNQRIRRIGTDGIISTVAGSGERPPVDSRCEGTGPVGDGGAALAARLYNPGGIAVHPNGSLIIADEQNNRIRQISTAGAISTIAGNGTHNLYAPGIPATSSPLDWPSAVAVDGSGIVYFAELHGNRVAKIGGDGRLATVAGTGFPGYNGDRIPAVSAQLTKPAGLAVDSSGNVYIADTGNHRVRKITPDGLISTIAGSGQRGFAGDGGAAENAKLDTPMDVNVDTNGNVYIADTGNHRVRRVDANRIITTVAGTGNADRGRDFTGAPDSALNSPSALAVDRNNDVYVLDWQNYLIRKISFDGKPVLTPGGVVNAASFTEPVAPGSIMALFGVNLAAAATSDAAWPDKLAGVSAEVNGTAIPLYAVSPTQLAGQLPTGLAAGTAQALVRIPGAVTNTITFPVSVQAPGIFLLSGGRAAAQNQDYTLNTPANPETGGNIVIVYLTGIGNASSAVQATIGDVQAEVLYAGPTPGTIGLAQANIRIPLNLEPASAVPVVIRAGGQTSNAAFISIR